MRHVRARRTLLPGVLRVLVTRVARESPALLVLGTLTAIGQSALLIPIAVVVRHMFDTEIPRRHVGSIVLSGVAILVLYAAAALLGFLAGTAALRTVARVITRLRLDLLAKVHLVPQQWHDRRRMAAVQSVVVQDTERVETMLVAVTGGMLPAVIVGIALVVASLVISPLLFLTSLAIVPPLMVVARLMARRVRALSETWSTSARRFTEYAQLLLRAIVTTRIVGAEDSMLRRGADHIEDLSERRREMGVASAGFNAIENAIAAAAGAAVLVVGGIAVAHRTMTVGALLAFYAVLGLLLRQVHAFGFQSSTVAIGLQSLRDVEALLAIDEREPYARGGRSLRFQGGIEVAGVTFAYAESPVLQELTLTIQPGEHVALIGPNGAGKSTLVNLLLGLYEPDQGLIRADSVPYDELDIRSLRRQIGVVLQDPVLLPGTIRENIAFARPQVTDNDVRAAADAATAAEFIAGVPDGYDATVGDEGTGLSGGQRQRIAIARALIGSPAMLVLDEPSTYLDDAAVTALMHGLMTLVYAPTVLLVTHDPQVGDYVDRVIELRAGQLVGDSGPGRRIGAARL